MRRRSVLVPTLQLLGHAVAGLAAPVLGLAGLTLLVIAAFYVATPLGLAAAGIGCLVVAVYVEVWRGSQDADESPAVAGRVVGTPGPFTPDGP